MRSHVNNKIKVKTKINKIKIQNNKIRLGKRRERLEFITFFFWHQQTSYHAWDQVLLLNPKTCGMSVPITSFNIYIFLNHHKLGLTTYTFGFILRIMNWFFEAMYKSHVNSQIERMILFIYLILFNELFES